MKTFMEKISSVRRHVDGGKYCVMIIGLGSVGSYLLDYLIGRNDEALKLVAVGRNAKKLRETVNIRRIAALIRKQCKSAIEIEGGVDFDNVDALAEAIAKHRPDFIVNSSRAYPGLNYGFISWDKIRAYGIWCPLSIHFAKNIMEACAAVDAQSIVINTSYPDASNAWLKSAGKTYPDLGSGNFNHLIPRMQYAVAELLNVEDFWNVEPILAAGHFHDVCISKDGHSENVHIPLKIYYRGQEVKLDRQEIFARCNPAIPSDGSRNMMNASSNYRLIDAIVSTLRDRQTRRIFPPGAFGNTGGYPVTIGFNGDEFACEIDTSEFTLEEMREVNQRSMYLDGIEKIDDGKLFYTDELIRKVKDVFDVELPKFVAYEEIDSIANFLVDKLLKPNLEPIRHMMWR